MELTAGVFDLFHYGHVRFLRTAYELALERLVVALNTDKFTASYKEKPVMSYEERKEVLLSTIFVKEVVPNNGDFIKILKKLRPKHLFIGSDWAKKDYYKQMRIPRQKFDKLGISLIYIPYTEGVSSTTIKEKIWTSSRNVVSSLTQK